jgi:KaiC/GvpD/RAD55 family RecA-like ATPase
MSLDPKRASKSIFSNLRELIPPHIEDLRARRGKYPKIPTTLPNLTEMLGGGFTPGVHYLCGAPGISKTAAVLQLARQTAEAGWPTYFVSLELPYGDLLDRMVSQELSLPWGDVRAGEHPEEADEVLSQLLDLPLHIATDVDNLNRIMQELNALKDSSFVIIDYLQIAASMFFKGDPRETTSEMCKTLAKFSRDRTHVLLVVSSMARTKYDKMKAEPSACLAAAKESGEVEYYASTLSVMIPSSESDENPRPGFWVLAKNRYNRVGKVPILIDGRRGIIEEANDGEIRSTDVENKILRVLTDSPNVHDETKTSTIWTINDVVKVIKRPRQALFKKLSDMQSAGLIGNDGKRGYFTTKDGLKLLKTRGVLLDGETASCEDDDDDDAGGSSCGA